MNIEELKLILGLVEKLGGDAKQIAIVYFALMAVKPLLACATVITIAIIVSRTIYKYTVAENESIKATRIVDRGWAEVCELLDSRRAAYDAKDGDVRTIRDKIIALQEYVKTQTK